MQVTDRFRLLSAALIVGLATLCGNASGQPFPPPKQPDPNLREVSMVQQDFSDCSNANVSPGTIGGTAWVVRGSEGITRVKLGITAKPNTTYHFFLKCVRILGDITTQEEGEGIATFEFRTNEVGNVYAFDMYPDGAPAGNKYQSVQVKY
jgi:hypothetical protein